MKRISREALNIKIAGLISLRGTCIRLQVGCVITYQGKIIATGYNGPPKDQPHCSDFQCNVDEPCKRAVHAEKNAIDQIQNPHRFRTRNNEDYVLYCTHQPCYNCAKAIINYTPVQTVYYINPYRDRAGLQLLLDANIKVIRIDEQGIPQD